MPEEKINQFITEKAKQVVTALKERQAQLGMKHGADPLTNIKTRLSKKEGIVNRIRITFKKSGVFVSKGVGRGTKITQVGNSKRKAKDWFNPVVEKFASEIMEEVADEWTDVVFDKLKIK